MFDYRQYQRGYFMPPVSCMDWTKKEYVDKAPVWCSVDLRDGNQALVEPMSLEQKVEFFKLLVKIGFKEIEVGFPAASETEYEFLRTLIEKDMIPDDVTIQVLTQAREHIIKKTFEAVKGAPRAVVHVYNSTSLAQREQVFRKSKEEIKQIAVDGAKLLKELAEKEDNDDTYYKWLTRIGQRNCWQPDKRFYHADDIAVSQSFLDLYRKYKDEAMIIPTLARTEWIVNHPSEGSFKLVEGDLKTLERWTWCDALFMAPPVYAKLYMLTGEKKLVLP